MFESDKSDPEWADGLVSMPGDDPKTEPIPVQVSDKGKVTALAFAGLAVIGLIITITLWVIV